MPTIKTINDIVINNVESVELYEQMVVQGLVNEDEIYIVGGDYEIWKPTVDEDGNLSWRKDNTDTPPTTQNIKYTLTQADIEAILEHINESDPVFIASPAHGITSEDISNWNSKGTYSKPPSGIPKTDLASSVQTSLGKADTAYQKPSSGIPATDLADGVIPTIDSAPTQNSENLVSSGGVYTAIVNAISWQTF